MEEIRTIYTILGLYSLLLLSACTDQKTSKTDAVKDKVQTDSVTVTRDTVWEGDTIVSISIYKESDNFRSNEEFTRSFTLSGPLSLLKYYHSTTDYNGLRKRAITTEIHFNVPSSKANKLLTSADYDLLKSFPIHKFKIYKYINSYKDKTPKGSFSKFFTIWNLKNVEKPMFLHLEDFDQIAALALEKNQFEDDYIDSSNCRSRIEKILDADLKVLEEKKKIDCIESREWEKSMFQLDTIKKASAFIYIMQFN